MTWYENKLNIWDPKHLYGWKRWWTTSLCQRSFQGYGETLKCLLLWNLAKTPLCVRDMDQSHCCVTRTSCLNPFTEHTIIREQTVFRAGKLCTSQLLNLTQHIEDGYEKSLTTGTVFVDMCAAYDTVYYILLLTKLYGMTEDAEFTRLIGGWVTDGSTSSSMGRKTDGAIRKMVYIKQCSLTRVMQCLYKRPTCTQWYTQLHYTDDLFIATQRSHRADRNHNHWRTT